MLLKIRETDQEIVNPVKCYTHEEKQITIMFNKDVISNRITENIARRPDIYMQDDLKKKSYIIDVTIVKDENYRISYGNKINKYRPLQEKIRRTRNITYVKIIPVVITINGFIYQNSLQDLKPLKLDLDWEKIIRTLLINEMKDLMFSIFHDTSIEV